MDYLGKVAENIRTARERLPEDVCLVAVSKYHPVEYLEEAYSAGQRVFGESHVQELRQKQPLMPEDVEWHFIGHLQTNKVKYIAPYISLIHAVDSMKLLREIDRQAAKCDRVIDVLLELHIAEESTKFGLTPEACRELLAQGEWHELRNVRICGLMMMASFTEDEDQIRHEMQTARSLFDELKESYFADAPWFTQKSWGMSDDAHIACETGSTMVRIGTAIFGPRVY